VTEPIHIPAERLRAMQIIVGAMVFAVLMFAGVVVFVLHALDEQPTDWIVSTVAVVFTCMGFVIHLIAPGIKTRQDLERVDTNDVNALCLIYQTKLIIGLPFLEGAAFLNIIATLQEHHWWNLAIAGGLVFWMLIMFPTETRVRQWVETQQFLADS